MKDDRLRVSVEADYTRSIGLAIYVFARLEWDAVWCIEKMSPGSIGPVSQRTAGFVATRLFQEVAKLGLAVDHPLLLVVEEFQRLVQVRNALCHGKPGTDSDRGQRLFREGSAWTVAAIDEAADEFSACQIKLNDFLYGYFGHPNS